MHIDQAIILCGGFGTRIKRKTLNKIPKSLIRVNDVPFIFFLIQQIINLKINKIIFCTGYLGHVIENEVNKFKIINNLDIEFLFSHEKIALGTAGSIINAQNYISGSNSLILNGDTYVNANLSDFINFHFIEKSVLTISSNLKILSSRYGKLNIKNKLLKKIIEKKFSFISYVYSGIFLIDNSLIQKFPRNKFLNVEDSFFIDNSINILVWKNYKSFIDIGTEYSLKYSSRFMSKIKLKYLYN